MNWVTEPLLLRFLQFFVGWVAPSEPIVDLERNIESEPTALVNKRFCVVEAIKNDRIFLTPAIVVDPVRNLQNILRPCQLVPRNVLELKDDRDPVSEDFVICHAAHELENSRRRIQYFQGMRALTELRNAVERDVMNELATLEEEPSFKVSDAGIGNLDSKAD